MPWDDYEWTKGYVRDPERFSDTPEGQQHIREAVAFRPIVDDGTPEFGMPGWTLRRIDAPLAPGADREMKLIAKDDEFGYKVSMPLDRRRIVADDGQYGIEVMHKMRELCARSYGGG